MSDEMKDVFDKIQAQKKKIKKLRYKFNKLVNEQNDGTQFEKYRDKIGVTKAVIKELKKQYEDMASVHMARKKKGGSKKQKKKLLEIKKGEINDIFYEMRQEKKKIEEFTVSLHVCESLSNKSRKFFETRNGQLVLKPKISTSLEDISEDSKRKIQEINEDLEKSKSILKKLQEKYDDSVLEYEKMKDGNYRKLRKEEITNPNSKHIYKWRNERKR